MLRLLVKKVSLRRKGKVNEGRVILGKRRILIFRMFGILSLCRRNWIRCVIRWKFLRSKMLICKFVLISCLI